MTIRHSRWLVLTFLVLVVISSQLDAQPRRGRRPLAPQAPPDPMAELALRSIDDCDQLRGFVTETVLEAVVQSRYGDMIWWANPWVGPWSSPGGEADGESGPDDYTTTNVQEDGVDELDIVKTDGEYVYVITEEEMIILDSWPAETAHELSRLYVGGRPYGLFLHDDTAIVIYAIWNGLMIRGRGSSAVRVDFVDISNRRSPRVVRRLELEGSLQGSRLINGQLYLVISTQMTIPSEVWSLVWRDDLGLPELPWDAPKEVRLAAAELARLILRPFVDQLIAELAPEDLLPLAWDSETFEETLLVDCSSLYRPTVSSSYGALSVVHLDLNQSSPIGGQVEAVGVLSDGWEVYASSTSLYVARSSRWWWWRAADVLSTTIHAFDLGTGPGEELSYRATGTVPGWLLNSFAMSEYDGVLRVATTEFDWWWGVAPEEDRDLGSRVTVLRDDGKGRMEELGHVAGIAPGEQIRAVRFMGDVGYIVTYQRIDPLFTLDLSDKADPRVLGELEIPGFSAYLHPMGEGYLLAVGMDGDEDGRIIGLGVSVFDVRDLANPRRIHKYTIESDSGVWSSSEALWDHHAFTYHRGVLSIPAYVTSYDHGYDFCGLVVLRATAEDGVFEIGRVQHGDLPAEFIEREDWPAVMRRSLYIEDFLFSLSDRGVKVNALQNPAIEYAALSFFEPPW